MAVFEGIALSVSASVDDVLDYFGGVFVGTPSLHAGG